MAVTFISKGYDAAPAGSAWADSHPTVGLAKYGVRSGNDWKVSAGSGLSVQIAAGRGFGCGVTDYTFQVETLTLEPVESGTRWDTIACRRDWRFDPRFSQFVKIMGGPAAAVAAGRQGTIGNLDDQPLALVPVTPDGIDASRIVDLRTWSGDGGGVVAAHDAVRAYLNSVGTRINVNGVDWLRRVGANDEPEWVKLVDASVPDTAWANLPMAQGFNPVNAEGWSGLKFAVRSGWVIVNGAVSRGSSWPTGITCAVVPAGLRPAVRIQGTNNAYVGPEGNVSLAAGSGAVSFSLTWPLF